MAVTRLHILLDIALEEARKDRDDVNMVSHDVEEKRGVASVVTKLEEAKMWLDREQTNNYYRKRTLC